MVELLGLRRRQAVARDVEVEAAQGLGGLAAVHALDARHDAAPHPVEQGQREQLAALGVVEGPVGRDTLGLLGVAAQLDGAAHPVRGRHRRDADHRRSLGRRRHRALPQAHAAAPASAAARFFASSSAFLPVPLKRGACSMMPARCRKRWTRSLTCAPWPIQ